MSNFDNLTEKQIQVGIMFNEEHILLKAIQEKDVETLKKLVRISDMYTRKFIRHCHSLLEDQEMNKNEVSYNTPLKDIFIQLLPDMYLDYRLGRSPLYFALEHNLLDFTILMLKFSINGNKYYMYNEMKHEYDKVMNILRDIKLDQINMLEQFMVYLTDKEHEIKYNTCVAYVNYLINELKIDITDSVKYQSVFSLYGMTMFDIIWNNDKNNNLNAIQEFSDDKTNILVNEKDNNNLNTIQESSNDKTSILVDDKNNNSINLNTIQEFPDDKTSILEDLFLSHARNSEHNYGNFVELIAKLKSYQNFYLIIYKFLRSKKISEIIIDNKFNKTFYITYRKYIKMIIVNRKFVLTYFTLGLDVSNINIINSLMNSEPLRVIK